MKKTKNNLSDLDYDRHTSHRKVIDRDYIKTRQKNM